MPNAHKEYAPDRGIVSKGEYIRSRLHADTLPDKEWEPILAEIKDSKVGIEGIFDFICHIEDRVAAIISEDLPIWCMGDPTSHRMMATAAAYTLRDIAYGAALAAEDIHKSSIINQILESVIEDLVDDGAKTFNSN